MGNNETKISTEGGVQGEVELKKIFKEADEDLQELSEPLSLA